MEYPTLQGKLIMPEYGRKHTTNDYTRAFDRKPRRKNTLCANNYQHQVGNMFPYLRDVNDFKHKLWDHVAIMSDFKLDIEISLRNCSGRKPVYPTRNNPL